MTVWQEHEAMGQPGFEVGRATHPVDLLEEFANTNRLAFDRSSEDELVMDVDGRWTGYSLSFSWIEEIEALHLACAFELKVPARRATETLRLLALVNRQLWVGHFDHCQGEGSIVFRHALLLTGGADPTSSQLHRQMSQALEACERYYPAFKFVLWGGQSARDALDNALFETVGNA